MKTYLAIIAAAALSTHAVWVGAGQKFAWAQGHGDLSVNYIDATWQWRAESERPPEEVVITLRDNARTAIPAARDFGFLGDAGNPIWVIPSAQTAGIPSLGISGEQTASGVLAGNRIDLLLSSVEGPGDFFVWTIGGTGAANVLMNSKDGITGTDRASVPVGGHFHPNWAFSRPGTYRIGFKASATLSASNTTITSDEQIYTFEVSVLKRGEVDIGLAYTDGKLELHVHDEGSDTEFEPDHVALQAGSATWATVPAAPAFGFLGNKGSTVYILPQEERDGILFLGLGAGEVPAGIFANDMVQLRLLDVDGPGNLAYYEIDAFGAPKVLLNSADGITDADSVPLKAGSHAHHNLAFTRPGIYRVSLKASGTLASGARLESEPATFLFEVMAPVFIDHGELDLEIGFHNGAWGLALHLHDGEDLDLDEVVIGILPAAEEKVPVDPAFAFLGSPGSLVRILPKEERDGLVLLGMDSDGVPAGHFVGDTFSLTLESFDGAGEFALFDVDSFGKPVVYMNTRDGISAADRLPLRPGQHLHLNWAFSSPGDYRVEFKLRGTPASGGDEIASQSIVLRFDVAEDHPAPLLSATLSDNGQNLVLGWDSETGVQYQLQSKTSLGSGAWISEGGPVAGTGGSQTLTVPVGSEILKVFQLLKVAP